MTAPEDPGLLHAATAMQQQDTSQSPPANSHTIAVDDDHISQVSSVSHASEPVVLNLSSSDLSHTNYKLPTTGEITPPSSTTSSNDQLGHRLPHSFQSPHKQTSSTESLAESTSHQVPPTLITDPIAGAKRTASGQIKKHISTPSDDVSILGGTRHARTTSLLSNGSNGNVMELSQQLRTKLTYAMIKVQNGWQGRSLDEVESLASQSPRSVRSGHQDRTSFLSPRKHMANKSRRTWSDSDSSESAQSVEPRSPTLVSNMQYSTSPQSVARRALAPPANIVPGSRRRSTLNGSDQQSQTPRPGTNQRTPSQNAAMEADAVETLLFMASPNNSGHHPQPHASQESSLRSTQFPSIQTSPLRTQFSQTSVTSPKRVAFTEPPMLVHHQPVDKAALIDRMLEALSDESDDELEAAFRMADRSQATKVST